MYGDNPDIIEERDNYRVRLQLDNDAQEPYNDGATPILRIGGDYYGRGSAVPFNKQTNGFEDAWNRLFECARNNAHHREIFERFLKIFHGTVKVQFYNEGASNEYGYVAFDTAAWREEMGLTDEQGLLAQSLLKEDYLDELRSWLEGDTWGYVVERKVRAITQREDYATGTALDPVEFDEWEEVEDGSCWGFYGREWAEQAAKEALEAEITHAGISSHYAEKFTPINTEAKSTLEDHVKHIVAAFPQVVPERDIFYNREGTEAIISVAQELDLGHSYVIAVDLEGNTTSSDAVWETGYTA
jgi:hypothetical protein